jgi:hypothetical protein
VDVRRRPASGLFGFGPRGRETHATNGHAGVCARVPQIIPADRDPEATARRGKRQDEKIPGKVLDASVTRHMVRVPSARPEFVSSAVRSASGRRSVLSGIIFAKIPPENLREKY